MPCVQPSTSWLDELQKEAFNILTGTVNARHGTSIKYLCSLSHNILVAGKAFFEDELTEEATWGSQHPHHVHFSSEQKGCLLSTPLKPSGKIGEDNILPPQQRGSRENLINPAMCPPRYEMHVAVQEFCKMHEPKINMLKGGHSAMANLIFQSWLKDIRVHVEDLNLMEKEAIQLVKGSTAEQAHDEIKFYMGWSWRTDKPLKALYSI